MSDANTSSKVWEYIIAMAVAGATALLALGSSRTQIQVNARSTEDNRNRILNIETRQAGYESDIRWIKETLTEIKDELKRQ